MALGKQYVVLLLTTLISVLRIQKNQYQQPVKRTRLLVTERVYSGHELPNQIYFQKVQPQKNEKT